MSLWKSTRRLSARRRIKSADFTDELLWETGASQSDAVKLHVENVDWESNALYYQRQKTGEWGLPDDRGASGGSAEPIAKPRAIVPAY